MYLRGINFALKIQAPIFFADINKNKEISRWWRSIKTLKFFSQEPKGFLEYVYIFSRTSRFNFFG